MGFDVDIDLNWIAGDDSIVRMNEAIGKADIAIIVWSDAYKDVARYGTHELSGLLTTLVNAQKRIVPLLIDTTPLPPLLKPMVPVRITGRTQLEALAALVDALTP